MSLISVEEATERLLSAIKPGATETVPLVKAGGRRLAQPAIATRTQPPFSASAMDGYAVRSQDAAHTGATLQVVGEIPAGHHYKGSLGPGQALRIFTGAPVPESADAILIQENAQVEGQVLTVQEPVSKGLYVRPAGLDFSKGQQLLESGQLLGYRELSLLAAMNIPSPTVYKRPTVAILANGDELVEPGNQPGPSQIIASNQYGLAELVKACGGTPELLGIAADTPQDIAERVKRAIASKADLLITLGGASVGDHDLIRPVLQDHGLNIDFWRIAMRPGKPLMFGNIGPMAVLGLPGNPVSSLVCAELFARPLLAALQGAPRQHLLSRSNAQAITTMALPANGIRQDYIRASLAIEPSGDMHLTPLPNQDSSMLSALTQADVLIIRPPHAEPTASGDKVPFLPLTSTN
ncbi:gephyrin-like molybdotransferase Glp [Polycladidibacter hongkongensis]|uniref:molybdopterin molybdotransferase MoeA n=1 Tax=Polycladidibacter hongkongensis TaxID=1647556 RepID=UPI000835FD15|nr:gephyrin-like molybdotransferase Glp [Pseudovibrio hongkongensis]